MTKSTPWHIRRAKIEDAQLLAEFGSRIFLETFAQYNRAEDMSSFLAATFSRERQAAELADSCSTYFLAEAAEGTAGYAMLRAGAAPPVITGSHPIRLQRLYVDSQWQGTGLAAELMAKVLEEARSRGARTLWLGVWERNDRALAFYRRWGFKDVGSEVFVLGTDPQIDRIMTRPVDWPSSTERGSSRVPP